MEEGERRPTGTNIVTVGDVCQRVRGASCCGASASALAGRVAIWPKCQEMIKIHSGGVKNTGREEKDHFKLKSSSLCHLYKEKMGESKRVK